MRASKQDATSHVGGGGGASAGNVSARSASAAAETLNMETGRLLDAASLASSERPRLRLLRASRSSSRTRGADSTRTGTSRCLTIARTMHSCWKSFSPNTATSAEVTLNSLRTTVHTPPKKCGRLSAQRPAASEPQGTTCVLSVLGIAESASLSAASLALGWTLSSSSSSSAYMSCGANTARCSVAFVSAMSLTSSSRFRGYVSKSSCGANCAGLT
mmetsp:Transcript_94/g.322  ORF Transcript_94/g.322 Transcript_94/m.322 type:complete len:216 (-) Transcript_94:298-945(-)